jgi:U3 small nucleolar RNA-associated protein 13
MLSQDLLLQDLDNAVMDKNYLRASKLAFRLKKPGRLLSIVSAILSAPAEPDAAPPGASAQVLTRLVASFNSSEVAQAFQYLRDWNATARHCHCAQALLHALLTTRSTTVCSNLFGTVCLLRNQQRSFSC